MSLVERLKKHPKADAMYEFMERYLKRHYRYYQPEDLTPRQWQLIDEGDIEPFLALHTKKVLDRVCVDRAIMIRNAAQQHFSLQAKTILDLGCNTGFFSHYFSRLGMRATGIDSNSHNAIKGTTKDAKVSTIATARRLNERYGVDATFVEGEIFSYLEDAPEFDVVLCLSLFHHFFDVRKGYGTKEKRNLDQLFKQIASKAKRLLYFEIDHRIADQYGWSEARLPELLQKKGNFKKVNLVGASFDAYCKYRNIYECVR